MSMELHVFLHDSRVPTRDDWQEAIRACGFELTLYPKLDPRLDTGFSPVVYREKETGFEFDLWPASEVVEAYPEIQPEIAERDVVANFRWGGDLLECGAAVIASAVLAQSADGLWFDPQEGRMARGEEAIAVAREVERELGDTH